MVKFKIFKGFSSEVGIADFQNKINKFLEALYDAGIDETSIFVDFIVEETNMYCYIQWTVE